MAKHDPKNARDFADAMQNLAEFDELTFQNKINQTVLVIEKDKTYNTNEKLKLYSLLSMLSNVDERERQKYVNKIINNLR